MHIASLAPLVVVALLGTTVTWCFMHVDTYIRWSCPFRYIACYILSHSRNNTVERYCAQAVWYNRALQNLTYSFLLYRYADYRVLDVWVFFWHIVSYVARTVGRVLHGYSVKLNATLMVLKMSDILLVECVRNRAARGAFVDYSSQPEHLWYRNVCGNSGSVDFRHGVDAVQVGWCAKDVV